MATLNFYLKKSDKQGLSLILLTYQGSGNKFRYAAKAKVNPAQWIERRQRVKVKSEMDDLVNNHLDSLASIISEAERESLLINHHIDFNYVKERFEEKIRGKKVIKAKRVIKALREDFQNFLLEVKATKTMWTWKHYGTCFNHLIKFEKEKNYKLTYESLNLNFYHAFVGYLSNDNKLLNNTVGCMIKSLKVFLNWATDRELNTILIFKKFKAFKEESEAVSLSEEELLRIFNSKKLTPSFMNVRDLFCFACFTGLRFSDIHSFKETSIKENYIEVKTEKTRQFIRIPLSNYAKDILLRNGGKLPKPISNQKMNNFLKEIAEICELNEIIRLTKYRGVEKVETIEPKYKLITTHTARRTFVTLSLEKGMRAETVMSITGHKDYHSFKKYIKLTDKVKLVEMNTIWNNEQ
ncbi:site-specific integrase [Daejeonella rubra]|nr:site-specific integrase [Daejeonella rubra]